MCVLDTQGGSDTHGLTVFLFEHTTPWSAYVCIKFAYSFKRAFTYAACAKYDLLMAPCQDSMAISALLDERGVRDTAITLHYNEHTRQTSGGGYSYHKFVRGYGHIRIQTKHWAGGPGCGASQKCCAANKQTLNHQVGQGPANTSACAHTTILDERGVRDTATPKPHCGLSQPKNRRQAGVRGQVASM